MTSLLVVVDCDGVAVLLDAEITYKSRADLTTLSQRLASDVKTYAAGYAGKAVHFGYAYANGTHFSASITSASTQGAVHVNDLAGIVVSICRRMT
jgi:hypothetical protein